MAHVLRSIKGFGLLQRANTAPPRLQRKPTLQHLKSSTVQGLPEMATAKSSKQYYGWLSVVIISHLACLWHLYALAWDFVSAPNMVSIEYRFEPETTFPVVHICPKLSRFLDTEKIEKVWGHLAVEMGLGLVHPFSEFNYVSDMDIANMTKFLNASQDLAAFAKSYYAQNMLQCQQVFKKCSIGPAAVNCCDIVELVYTMLGPCYVTKQGALRASDLVGGLAKVKLSVTHFEPPYVSKNSFMWPSENQPYRVFVSEALEQSPEAPNLIYLRAGEFVIFQMRKQRRKQMPSSGKCIQGPRLKYFHNYTTGNCIWQKFFFDRLPLLNVSCQLPAVALLNSYVRLDNPCKLQDILKLYDYRPLTEQEKMEFFPQNSLEKLLLTARNTKPSMLDLVARLQQLKPSQTNPCPLPCMLDRYLVTQSKDSDPDVVGDGDSQIQFYFETTDVEVIEESEKQSIGEYIALIGGNFGLWTGASLISMAHLFALFIKACFDSSIEQQQTTHNNSTTSKQAATPPRKRTNSA